MTADATRSLEAGRCYWVTYDCRDGRESGCDEFTYCSKVPDGRLVLVRLGYAVPVYLFPDEITGLEPGCAR
jgi:hypothetical protein